MQEGSNSLVPFTDVTVPVNVLTIGHLYKLAILVWKNLYHCKCVKPFRNHNNYTFAY